MSLFYSIKGKRLFYIPADLLIMSASYAASLAINSHERAAAHPDPGYIIVMFVSFLIPYYLFQVYRVIWVYSNLKDMYRLIYSNCAGFALLMFSSVFAGIDFAIQVAVMNFLMTTIITVLYRVVIRDFFSRYEMPPAGARMQLDRKILIIGAGEAGRLILSEYTRMGIDGAIVGFVDDDMAKIGKLMSGKMIFAPISDIGQVMKDHKINEVFIAAPSATEKEINRIIRLINTASPGMPVKILPSFTRIFDGPITPDLREMGIADLLDREEISIDTAAIEKNFSGKTILITGAGGSIGSELCRQILKFRIKKLVAVGKGEHSIYELIKSLNEFILFLDYRPEIIYKICDVRDEALMDAIFREHRPDIVFHAAAHKHVPLMEFNEAEAVQNNIIGTWKLLEVSHRHGVGEFVLISTDKAVHPVNIMGATKRIAEILTQYYFREKGLRAVTVRFGNVIGSRGSVIPLFREQIAKGGPVTITHPDVTRYFMSIPEASLLVLNSAALTEGGEVFVLDMGRQYKISDIARNLIRHCGYEPDRDIRIEFTGLRPGEKLYEELYYDSASLISTANDKISILNAENAGYNRELMEKFLFDGFKEITKKNSEEIRKLIKEIVPEYNYDGFIENRNGPQKFVS
jgi:FlaA1/EpsC-like NDP-sugar epimerase